MDTWEPCSSSQHAAERHGLLLGCSQPGPSMCLALPMKEGRSFGRVLGLAPVPPTHLMPCWAIHMKNLELMGYLQVGAKPPFSQSCYNNSIISTHRVPCSPRGEHVLYFISRDILSPTCCPKHRMPHRTSRIYCILLTDGKAPLLISGTCDFVWKTILASNC